MNITVSAEDKVTIDIHHVVDAENLAIMDTADMADRIIKREIKIGNLTIWIFGDDEEV